MTFLIKIHISNRKSVWETQCRYSSVTRNMHFFNVIIFGYSCFFMLHDVQLLPQTADSPQPRSQKKYKVFQELQTWKDALEACKTQNLKLAEIISYQQQKELRAYIRQNNLLPRDSKSGYWLGGIVDDGRWIWYSTGKDYRDQNQFMAGWQFGEPDGKVRNGVSQECMELQYRNDSKFTESLSWNDQWCDEKRGSICETWDENTIIN